jgi:hypothetical protein
VDDPEEPRPQLEVPPLVLERGERPDHRALQGVLGVMVVAQDRAAVAVEVLVVALIDRRERLGAAARDRGRARGPAAACGEPEARRDGGYEP